MRKLIIPIILFLTIISMVSAVDIASDSFESNSFSGGLGWSGDWTVNEGYAIVYYGSHDSGTYSAYMSGKASIQRDVDTTGYSDVTLGFWIWAVNVPISVNYTIDGVETNLLTIDSVTGWQYYEYSLPSGVTTIKFSDDSVFSQAYVDDITITGEVGVEPEVTLIIDNNYVVDNNVIIYVDSTETNTIHSVVLEDAFGNVFCDKNVVSPSVSNTLFSVNCDMPSSPLVDAKAFVYVTNDESINSTSFFNVISLEQNPNEIDISQVYFSPQVLQGGSIEIFAIIENITSLDYAQLELTYPNGGKRILSMQPTSNLNEYRAFVTDTYLVGNVSFEISAKTGNYFDVYNNQYQVVAYNVDFVNLVNEVSEVLNVKTVQNVNETTIEVHGTEYRALDPGRMFIQLLDGYDAPVNDSDCYMSIYYPDNSPFKYQQKMTYVDEGLYFYDFITPYMNGVYMVSSYCVIEDTGLSDVFVTDGFEGGISGGSGWDGSWTLNGATISSAQSNTDIYSLLMSDDDDPTRDISGSSDYSTMTISFYHRTSSMENGEYYYVYFEDASDVTYELLSVTDGDDDGNWKYYTETFSVANDNIDLDGSLRFYLDSNGATEPNDLLYIDDVSIEFQELVLVNETEYQVVRGSGEVHVTSDFEYTYELTQGELYYDNFYEGFRQYYDIISQVYTDTEEVEIMIPIYEPFPCDHVIGLQIYNETSSSWDNISNLKYEYNVNGRNRCNVKFDLDLDTLETYQVRTDSENYWKQKIVGDYQDNRFLYDLVEIACVNYQSANGLDNFSIPVINQSNSTDNFYLSCYSFFNSYYYYNEEISANFLPLLSIETNFTTDEMNLLESSFLHIQDVGHEVQQYGTTILQGLGLGNSYSLAILNDPYPPVNPTWANYFANISSSYLNYLKIYNLSINSLTTEDIWNYTDRNLTYYPPVEVNTTAVAEAVWEWSGFIEPSILGNITSTVWDYVGRYTHGIIA